MKEPMREHFTFFASFYDALSDLNDADRLACYDAICQFALTGKEPKIEGIVSTVFKLVKPVLDKSKTRSEVGKIGGKNKQNESKRQANAKQTARDKEYGVGVGVGVGVGSVVDVECNVAHTREDDDTYDTHDTHDPQSDPTGNKPTMEQIVMENQIEGYKLNGQSLRDFYEYNDGRGWKMDWRKALKRWADREKEPPGKMKSRSPAGSFANFPQRNDPEHDELVRQVIAMK